MQFLHSNFIRLLKKKKKKKSSGFLRRDHEPSGRPKSLLLSEDRDTILTTSMYFSFSEETDSPLDHPLQNAVDAMQNCCPNC